MSLQVVFLHAAEQDLRELRRYIVKQFGEESWQASYARIKAVAQLLQSSPLAGHIPDELVRLQLTQYRQIMAGKNRIIYEQRQGVIYIHIVCDARMEMGALLYRRLLRS